MPRQVQAQQQTVIVKVAAPEKKRRKRRSKRKPKQPTGEDVLRMAQPIAVYTPLAPTPDTGSQFRELLTAVTMIKAKQDAMGSFTPQYVNQPDIVDLVREPQEQRVPEPVPEFNARPQPEPEPTWVAAPQKPQVLQMEQSDYTSLIKLMKKVDKSITNKNHKNKWKEFSEEDKYNFNIVLQRSGVAQEKKDKLLTYLESL